MNDYKEKSKIIVNCISVKKNAGGAYQIAQNFIKKTFESDEFEWYYLISDDLREFIIGYHSVPSDKIAIFPTQPDFFGTYLAVTKQLRKLESRIVPDLVYSIASPSYFYFTTKEIMRYANAWFVNVNRYALKNLGISKKVRLFLLTKIQHHFLKKGKYFITQTQISKQGIGKITKCPKGQIKVIPNTLPTVYKRYQPERRNKKLKTKSEITILYIAVPHPQKRLELIPPLLKALKEQYPTKKITFYLTIPNGDFLINFNENCKKLGVSENIKNFGYCSQDQLADLYQNADIFFFPSILETFSLSILEAIFFRLPTVASDLNFNRDIADDAVTYFDPDDLQSARAAITNIIEEDMFYMNLQDNMEKFVKAKPEFFDYELGFNETISFFKEVIRQK